MSQKYSDELTTEMAECCYALDAWLADPDRIMTLHRMCQIFSSYNDTPLDDQPLNVLIPADERKVLSKALHLLLGMLGTSSRMLRERTPAEKPVQPELN